MKITSSQLRGLIREMLTERSATAGDKPITTSEFVQRQDEIYTYIDKQNREQGTIFVDLRTRVEKLERIVHELQQASRA